MSDCISIHAPPRGATWKPCKSRSNHLFQFTPLREGRRKAQSATAWHPYFNSRPSARGDVCGKYSDNSITISIHAPPRGATIKSRTLAGGRKISIHAPPRGATGTRRICGIRSANFNSRPSARGDMTRISLKSAANKISIHAPPRGATRLRMAGRTGEKFQFTPLREGRPFRPCDQPCATAFQFTPLREGRRLCLPR